MSPKWTCAAGTTGRISYPCEMCHATPGGIIILASHSLHDASHLQQHTDSRSKIEKKADGQVQKAQHSPCN